MRLVLYGNFSIDYCSEVHYAKTLESLGHNVICLQENTVDTDTVLNESLKSDALIWVHSHGFLNKGRPMTDILEELKRVGIPTLAYHLDLYMGLERWKEYENSPYMKVQHFFTVDKLMADWFNKNTEVKGHYILAGVYDQECYIHPDYDPENFENDVIFVGSRNYHHEWPWRPQLVDWLKATYGDRFKHYGNDGLGTVRGEALNRLYTKSKVVVGDSLCPGFNYPYYSTDRLFETTGRGGFLIYPSIPKLDHLFRGSVPRYDYGNFDQIKEHIDHYLGADEERETRRMAAHAETKANHTYVNRWQEILSKI